MSLGGSEPIQPTFTADPFASQFRQLGFGRLAGLSTNSPQGAGFTRPQFTQIGEDDPFFGIAQGALGDFLGGTGQGTAGVAGRTLQEGIETGFRPDLDPIFQRSQNFLQNELLPATNENLGAQFGIRFGTPQAEAGARAARDTALGVNEQVLPFLDSAANRRLQSTNLLSDIIGQAGQLGAQRGSLREARTGRAAQNQLNSTQAFFNSIINGLSAASGSTSRAQFDNSGAQNQAALISLLGTIIGSLGGPAGSAAGGAAGAAVGQAVA